MKPVGIMEENLLYSKDGHKYSQRDDVPRTAPQVAADLPPLQGEGLTATLSHGATPGHSGGGGRPLPHGHGAHRL